MISGLPCGAIDGYSFILKQSAGARLDENEQHYIDVVRHNVGIMENLIERALDALPHGSAGTQPRMDRSGPAGQGRW